MLFNATILRIDHGVPGADGVWHYDQGEPLKIRCLQKAPTRRQRYELGATIEEATDMIHLQTRDLGEATIGCNDQVVVKLDRRSERTFRVVEVTDTVKSGGMDNRQVFLAEVKE